MNVNEHMEGYSIVVHKSETKTIGIVYRVAMKQDGINESVTGSSIKLFINGNTEGAIANMQYRIVCMMNARED